uniref:Phosphonate-binding periplasmic protein n=1 Tax=Acidovorax sp. GW2 TaxID=446363 RepID=F8QRD0_9BURK|nr:phosphonate-binding periplasmic protein [Acidovorax sp. GW2]
MSEFSNNRKAVKLRFRNQNTHDATKNRAPGAARPGGLRWRSKCPQCAAHSHWTDGSDPRRPGGVSVALGELSFRLYACRCDLHHPRVVPGNPGPPVRRTSGSCLGLRLPVRSAAGPAGAAFGTLVRRPAALSLLPDSPDGPAPKIEGWADLKGRVLAYSDPLSNSGWLVPQAQLRQAGLRPGELRRSFFAHGHRNVAEAVAAQLADAGCIDGYVWETMRRQGMAAAFATEVVWRSESFGFPPLVVQSGMYDAAARRLQSALAGMDQDALGKSLLQALNLDGFAQEPASIFASIERLADEQAQAG